MSPAGSYSPFVLITLAESGFDCQQIFFAHTGAWAGFLRATVLQLSLNLLHFACFYPRRRPTCEQAAVGKEELA